MNALPDWLQFVKEKMPGWIEELTHPDGPGRYRFAVEAYEPYELFSSGMMQVIIHTVGRGAKGLPGIEEKKQTTDYFLSFQRPEDGLIIDPAVERHYTDQGGQAPASELFGFRMSQTRNTMNWVVFLGGKPRYRMTHQETFKSAEELTARLERLHWHNPWGAGSWAGAALCFQEFNRLLGDEKAQELLRAGLAWLTKRQDPESGAWHDGTSNIALYRLINGIFKVWIQTVPLGLPVQYPEKVIDLCLRGLEKDPELNEKLDACSIFDLGLVLDTALRFSDHRRAEIADIARRRLALIEPHVRPDGAFSYGPSFPRFFLGPLALAPMIDQGNVQGTALLCQAVAFLANLSGLRDDLGWTPTTEWKMGL